MVPDQTRVLIDGFNLALEQGTGVATYARNLTHVCKTLGNHVSILYGKDVAEEKSPLLTEINFFDPPVPRNQIQAFLSRLHKRSLSSSQPLKIPISGEVVLSQKQAQTQSFDEIWNARNIFDKAEAKFWLANSFTEINHPLPLDIAHWTYPLPVRAKSAINIYTVHDLVPLRLPYTTLDNKKFYLRLLQQVVKRGDHIITVSEHSRQDIIRILGCPEDKVTNTYQSVEIPKKLLDKSADEVRAEIEGAFGLPYKGYLLFFGAIEPKKNVGRLIEAYLASSASIPLVLVGRKAWKSDEELRLLSWMQEKNATGSATVDPSSKSKRILHLDYLPFSMLVSAIRCARATIFPSLYEGFGLPVLESMLLGTPVITSRKTATAEVAGDAATLIDPYDVSDIAAAISRFSIDEDLMSRLSMLGQIQAKKFSSARHCEKIQKLYERLLISTNQLKF